MATVKFSPAITEKCKKQVEFYFSDSNAPRDAFLMSKIESHPEGYVELAVIAAFARMAQHMGTEPGLKPDEVPSTIISQLAEALQDSETLEVSEDKEYVKRKVPLQSRSELLEALDKRTLYIRPFPFDSILEHLVTFFNQYAPVGAVRMRRYMSTKDFKGSIFVEFDTPESAAKVEAMKDLVHEGATLRPEFKKDYLARKDAAWQEHLAKKEAKKEAKAQANGDGEQAAPAEVEEGPRVPYYKPGLLLRFEMPGEPDLPADFNFFNVKQGLGGTDAGIGFVEFNKDLRGGHVRITGEAARETLLAKRDADGCLPLGDFKIKPTIVEGEAEKEFYIRADQNRIRADALRRQGGGPVGGEKRKKKWTDPNARGRGRFGRRGRFA